MNKSIWYFNPASYEIECTNIESMFGQWVVANLKTYHSLKEAKEDHPEVERFWKKYKRYCRVRKSFEWLFWIVNDLKIKTTLWNYERKLKQNK